MKALLSIWKVTGLSWMFIFIVGIFLSVNAVAAQDNWRLFGYQETQQLALTQVPHWLDLLDRHSREDIPEGNCTSGFFNTCHLKSWLKFLEGIRGLSTDEQISKINYYANTKSYVLDIDNYGISDYWAIVRQFLYNGGDCEDYAITKLMSLQYLGFDINKTRIVVLQDTNLRIAHAVLAVARGGRILIMDNQVEEIVPHNQIVHYIPLYSVNESSWWIHTPPL